MTLPFLTLPLPSFPPLPPPRIPARAGEQGLQEFKDEVTNLFGIDEDTHTKLTFGCKEPIFGRMLKLGGDDAQELPAFNAAVHCARVSAAERITRGKQAAVARASRSCCMASNCQCSAGQAPASSLPHQHRHHHAHQSSSTATLSTSSCSAASSHSSLPSRSSQDGASRQSSVPPPNYLCPATQAMILQQEALMQHEALLMIWAGQRQAMIHDLQVLQQQQLAAMQQMLSGGHSLPLGLMLGSPPGAPMMLPFEMWLQLQNTLAAIYMRLPMPMPLPMAMDAPTDAAAVLMPLDASGRPLPTAVASAALLPMAVDASGIPLPAEAAALLMPLTIDVVPPTHSLLGQFPPAQLLPMYMSVLQPGSLVAGLPAAAALSALSGQTQGPASGLLGRPAGRAQGGSCSSDLSSSSSMDSGGV